MLRNQITDSWPPDRVSRLLELRSDPKLPLSEITKHLNLEYPTLPKLSRNAVAGKLKRINDRAAPQRRQKSRPHTRLNPRQEKSSTRILEKDIIRSETKMGNSDLTNHSSVCYVGRCHVANNKLNKPPAVVPPAKPVPYEELKSGQCKWPVAGDPAKLDTLMCCAKPVDRARDARANYCPEHAAIAHPQKRSERARGWAGEGAQRKQ